MSDGRIGMARASELAAIEALSELLMGQPSGENTVPEPKAMLPAALKFILELMGRSGGMLLVQPADAPVWAISHNA
ncbi:MAG: hypothetical protein ACRDH2_17725, partial [Anaerolineales bacterium]